MDDEGKDMDEIVAAIRLALANLKFGSVEITVHDAKVVQIERKEKVRINGIANQKRERNA